MELFKQLKWYFIQEWKRYTGAFIILSMVTFLQLMPSKMIGATIDLILNNQASTQQVLQKILKIIFTSTTVYILRNCWRILLFGASYNLASQLREKFCSALLKKNTIFYSKYKNGDLISRATNDIDRVVFASGEGILTIIDSLCLGCSMFTMMCVQTNWKLTCFALSPMPIMAFIIKKYGNHLYINFQKSQKSFSLLNNQAQDSLTNIHMIKNFGLEKKEIKKFSMMAISTGKKDFQVSKIDSKFDPIIHIFIALSNLFAILGGSFLIAKKQLTFGQLTSFILYLGSMIWPILAFAWMFNILERGNVSWKRIKKIIKKNRRNDSCYKKIKTNKKNYLKINIKKFSYPERTNKALKRIKLLIFKKTNLGICGPTGSGKTTLIRLIQRHFVISSGYIKYRGCNIKKICIKKWYSKISMVDQIPFLFSDSILNNIAFKDPNANLKQIKKAAKLACIHHEIKKLPQGYHTQIGGKKGIKLSGGQKQRITIARAFLTPSKIFILDDPLSSVDHETEHKIITNIRQYSKTNKITMIIVTHRLSILEKFKNIVVFKKGKILQQGSHKKLLSENNWYHEMYNYQKFK